MSSGSMRALQPHQVTILTTNTCTATCAHCSMNSGRDRTGRLSFEQIRRYVDQAVAAAPIDLIIFAGGEPLLLKEDLFRSLRHIKSKGLCTRLVTNAYWAVNDHAAARVCRELREAGLDELNISIDDFHLPYIDAQRVRRAFDAARKLDFRCVILVHCTGPETEFNDRELDELIGMKLPRLFDQNWERLAVARGGEGPVLAVSNTPLQAIGRGSQFADRVTHPEGWDERVRSLGGCPFAVRSPAISPDGRLVSCCGFEVAGNEILDIGDLESHTVGELLDQADDDLPLNLIALEGPFRLMDFLKEKEPDLPFKSRYTSYCELCQDIVARPELREALLRNMVHRVADVFELRRQLLDAAHEEADLEARYEASKAAG